MHRGWDAPQSGEDSAAFVLTASRLRPPVLRRPRDRSRACPSSAATENLLLAAAGLELGAVWVGVYPQTGNEEHVRRVLSIPRELRVLCLVPMGHPGESKPPHTKYDERKIHYDRY